MGKRSTVMMGSKGGERVQEIEVAGVDLGDRMSHVSVLGREGTFGVNEKYRLTTIGSTGSGSPDSLIRRSTAAASDGLNLGCVAFESLRVRRRGLNG